MMPIDIDVGDVLVWPETPRDRFRVQDVRVECSYAVVISERTNGTKVEFHYPIGHDLPAPGNGGPEIYPSEGGTCEACEVFLHDDDPGRVDPVSGSLFCSECREVM